MKILVLLSLLLISFNVMADKRKEFIRKYKHIAIREMERTGIPASITLAQGILESGCGESELAVNANNHFDQMPRNLERRYIYHGRRYPGRMFPEI